jgi:hypothetical protein
VIQILDTLKRFTMASYAFSGLIEQELTDESAEQRIAKEKFDAFEARK